MDVTLLLNAAGQPDCCRQSIEYPLPHYNLRPSPEVLSKPYTEDSEGKTTRCKSRNRTPCGAQGYAIPRSAELESPSGRTDASISPRHPRGAGSRINNESSHGSAESSFALASPQLMHLARHDLTRISPSICASGDALVKSNQATNRDHTSYPRETPTTSKHEISFSSGSLASCESPQSEYHSILSSVTSVSGVSFSRIPVIEIPLITSKLLEVHRPQPGFGVERIRFPPTLSRGESFTATPDGSGATERSHSPSDAVLNMKGLVKLMSSPKNTRPRPITLPKLHKRAISAPALASRFSSSPSSSSSSKTTKLPFSLVPLPRGTMNESPAKAVPAEAEESGPARVTAHQSFDSEQRPSRHHSSGNGRETNIVDHPTSFAADAQLPDTVCDSISLLQPSQSITRRLSLETANAAPTASLEEPRCMFVDDCQTGSQLRKAISHLFGRNKACTLRIPKEVWFYYCRKHYQRVRYRNSQTYPLNQMQLVKLQIERLEAWSDDNRRNEDGPYINMWTLTLRKREQSRLDKEKHHTGKGDDESQGAQNGSSVPDWIVQRLGSGYTTEQMLEVVARLHDEIDRGILSQVPGVEFLPDITEPEGQSEPKPARNRRQTRAATGETGAPKRKMSDVTEVVDRNGSSLILNRRDEDELTSPLAKRPRISPHHMNQRHQTSQLPPPSTTMSTLTSSYATAPSAGSQSSIPRSFPAVPRLQMHPHGYAQSPGGHMHGHASNDVHRAGPSSGFYSHDQQHSSTHYRYRADHSQPSPFQWNREHYNDQRLPPISVQVPEMYDTQSSTSMLSLSRMSGAVNDGLGISRPRHQRSYSAYAPTSQSGLDYSRPSSSSSGHQAGLPSFDNRAAGPLTYDLTVPGYSREQWAEPEHSYTSGGSQSYAAQQQSSQPAPLYDQTTRQRMGSLRALTYSNATRLPTASERAEYGSHGYADTWHRADQGVARMTGEVRED